ncbi:MAG: exo-alpha-sialidase, partial [Gammaproteobacteria bacterium]
PEWLRLSRHGEVLGKYRIAGGKDLLQPALVPLTTQHVLAFMRYKGPAPHRVMRAESVDGGQHWSTPTATDVPNPNSAVAVLRLRDGRLLMAANPIRSNRNVLALLISRDDGRHWQRIVTLEEGGSEAEFSYPYMIRSGDRIDLAYTWRRKRIRHVRFNLNWLNGKARAAQRDPAAADRPIFQESGS